MSNVEVIAPPIAEMQPGIIDMAEFEAEFEQAEAIQAAGTLAVSQEAQAAEQEEVQMLVGFNPNLLAMFLRATPDSEMSKGLANLLVADLVVNNAVAYGLIERQQTENLYHYTKDSKED